MYRASTRKITIRKSTIGRPSFGFFGSGSRGDPPRRCPDWFGSESFKVRPSLSFRSVGFRGATGSLGPDGLARGESRLASLAGLVVPADLHRGVGPHGRHLHGLEVVGERHEREVGRRRVAAHAVARVLGHAE